MYYSEHRPKIGAIELSIRPDVLHTGETHSVQISKKGIQVRPPSVGGYCDVVHNKLSSGHLF